MVVMVVDGSSADKDLSFSEVRVGCLRREREGSGRVGEFVGPGGGTWSRWWWFVGCGGC